MKITIKGINYIETPFTNEYELETAVMENANQIFGEKAIYIDVKKRIKNKKNSFANIPDAYLIDFRHNPKLWVVENELATHDSLKHIGVQLLKFATQFSEGSYQVKETLFEKIKSTQNHLQKINKFIKHRNLANISEALDYVVFKNDFGFIIVIDEIDDDLQRVTAELAKTPELVTIRKFVAGKENLYLYDEFLQELEQSSSSKINEVDEIDTIVAAAKPDGFKKAFLKQKAWWAVRISPSVLPKLKYLAMYEVNPVKSINWYGKIQSIKPYQDTGKYIIYCSKIKKINPIKMGNSYLAPQSPRYTKFELLKEAQTLADIF